MPSQAETLVLRTDANRHIGSGHVMRCLALAQAWQDRGGQAIFVMTNPPAPLVERLRAEQVEVELLNASWGTADDARRTAEFARRSRAKWVVVDGYHFGSDYQQSLAGAGLKLLFIDDNGHAERYCADVVLNHNLHAREDLFKSRSPETQLLLGPRYAMLRREFGAWRSWRRQVSGVARNVLVTMGGSDPENVTTTVIGALPFVRNSGFDVTVVVGGSNPHIATLKQAAAGYSGPVRFEANASNMPELLAWADVAVSAAGTTCWEMCLLGLPAILIDVAENQHPVATELDRRGAAIHLGSAATVSPEKIAEKLGWLVASLAERKKLSSRAREVVDGKGAARVVAAMKGDLHLRRAEEADCRLLWEWANDPAVRAASFSGDTIPWNQHEQWFRSKLSDGNVLLCIAMNSEGKPIGHIRYQIEGDAATVSISISPQFRDMGYGHRLLTRGSEEVFRNTAATAISAYVKPENRTSLRLFRRAGFATAPPATIHGQAAVHFILSKNGSG